VITLDLPVGAKRLSLWWTCVGPSGLQIDAGHEALAGSRCASTTGAAVVFGAEIPAKDITSPVLVVVAGKRVDYRIVATAARSTR
jgi:ABC-type sulfate transport system permease component